MSAKQKQEIPDAPDDSCLVFASNSQHVKTYVKFRNGHLQLDVRGFLGSREGKESVAKVIGLSKGIPKKPNEENYELSADSP